MLEPHPFRSTRVDLAESSWVAPNATVVGEVRVGERSSVWYGCVVRGDLEPIEIGVETSVQDLSVVHVDHGMPTVIGDRVTIGHRVVVHGCRVGDDAVVGMGAVLLSGCSIGTGAVVAAGAVVREGFEVSPGQIVAGVPARIVGAVTAEQRERFAQGVANYVASTARQVAAREGAAP